MISRCLYSKMITYEHCIYIINKILVSRLVYLLQFSTIPTFTLNSIYAPIRTLFKHKLNLSKHISDVTIFNILNPNIIDIMYINHIINFTNLNVLFNNPSFHDLVIQKIDNSLNELWIPSIDSISSHQHKYSSLRTLSWLSNNILEFESMNLHLTFPQHNTTLGGRNPIIHYLLKSDAATLTSLKKKGIMFMD